MTPAEKFRSDHMPRASEPLHVVDGSASTDSGVDKCSNAKEVDIFNCGRYSFVSLAQPPHGCAPVLVRQHVGKKNYYSTDGYSDLSSSRETMVRGRRRGDNRHVLLCTSEEEHLDPA
ncbi:hypothetical protein ZWY2020_001936 [Hordeum vulgare]|nr:hypothetical protein ZWY2020_001936 [Hordeum vulgare]